MKRGRCPTLLSPMSSGDGLLARVRPQSGVLGSDAARALAKAAARHGNGVIELTNRAGLQIRGLRPESAAPFAADVIAAGLADLEPASTVILPPPLAGDDPTADPRAFAVVADLARKLSTDSRLSALPGKFGVLVDAGGILPTMSAPADIRMLLTYPGVTSKDTALIALDGTSLAAVCDFGDIVSAVVRLAVAAASDRMRGAVARHGADAVFARASLVPSIALPPPRPPDALGWLPYPGVAYGAFGVGLPFGETDAATLMSLADVADRFGDRTLRPTPWRAFVIPHVTAPNDLRDALASRNVMVSSNDARARVTACPGTPSCATATVPARADAVAVSSLGFAGIIHISGCTKGCAHPAPADLTLVGNAGRYALVRHGRAADPPDVADLTLSDVLNTLSGTTA